MPMNTTNTTQPNTLVNQYHVEFFLNGTKHAIAGPSPLEIKNQLKLALRMQGEPRFVEANNAIQVYLDSHMNGREPLCVINEIELPASLSVAWQTRKASEKVAA